MAVTSGFPYLFGVILDTSTLTQRSYELRVGIDTGCLASGLAILS